MGDSNNPNEGNNLQNNQAPNQQQYQQPQNNQMPNQQQYQQPQNNQTPYQQQYQQPQSQYQQPQYGGQPVYQQPQYSGQSQYQQNSQPQYQQPYNPYQQPPRKEYGLAVASMVCGIVSVVINCCIVVWYLSIATAIVGIILGIVSIKGNKDGKGMAIAGIILSGVGFLIAIIAFIGCLAIGSQNFWNDFRDEYNNALGL